MAITSLRTTRDFARVWFYWQRPAIFTFLIIVIGICLYSFTRTPIYTSTAKILLLPKTNDALVVTAGQGSRQYDIQGVTPSDLNTEVELIQNKNVIKRTVEFFQQADLDSKNLSEKENNNDRKGNTLFTALNVEPIYDSNMISISMDSLHQYKVAEVLNKLMEEYIHYHKNMYIVKESEEFYDEQKQYYGKKLREARLKLKKFNNLNNLANINSQIQANIALISTFTEQLQSLDLAIAENEAKIDMLKKGLNVRGSDFTISREMRSMPVIVELARGLVPLLIKRTEIGKTFTRQSREFKQIDDQIAMLREEIRKEGMNTTKTDQMTIKSLIIKRDALKKKIKSLMDQSKEIQQKQQELNALELDLDIAKKNYLLYGSKTEDSRLYVKRNETNMSNVVIAEAAVTPTKQTSPNRLLAFEVAVFLGLFAALILPFILETLDHKIKTSDDIENILALPVVCTYNEV